MIHVWLLAALAAAPARSAISAPAIVESIESAQTAVRAGDDALVGDKARQLEDAMNGHVGVYAPVNLGHRERWQAAGKQLSVPELIAALKNEQYRVKSPATPMVQRVISELEAMYGSGRMTYRTIDISGKALDDKEMGRYTWSKGHEFEGAIALNYALRDLGYMLPASLIVLTAVHEVAHKIDEDSAKTELFAFFVQYRVLNWMLRTNRYAVADLRVELEKLQRRAPAEARPAIQQALDYTTTLDVLDGTKGSPDKIKEMIRKLGYDSDGAHLSHASA